MLDPACNMTASNLERSDRQTIARAQASRLSRLIRDIHGRNAFYTRKFDAAGLRPDRLAFPGDLAALPFTTKNELAKDQQVAPPWGTNLTEPIDHYTRYNQTSSTTGQPLRWLDTNESWQWMLECWKAVYGAAQVTAADRILFAFSFGPFLGFWTAFEAGCQLGAHCVPAGGMSSQARLALIDMLRPTVVCCTPTYALRLAEVADQRGRGASDLAKSSVRLLIVAGEAGGSIPATRSRIEKAWGARVIDHHGLTEVGPVSFECWESPGSLHLNECEYVCEVIGDTSDREVADGERGELVITNLGRTASPVIRYRTGDVVVRRSDRCGCGRTLARLVGGILSRTDDMVNVRGVNVYPSAVEAVIRGFDEVVEYRATVASRGALRELSLEIEVLPGGAPPHDRIAAAMRETLGLTVPVRIVDAGMLPRFEMKSRRFIVEGDKN
jgi:phenylacetate-CoA ligase